MLALLSLCLAACGQGPALPAAAPPAPVMSAQAKQNDFRVDEGLNAAGSMGLWASGSMGLWGSGSMGLWGSGSMGLWGSGTYSAVPGNTASFTQINLEDAQRRAPNLGAGVTIATIDTGADLTHPALRLSLSDPSSWADFVSGDRDPSDEGQVGSGEVGHGTAVAGLLLQIAPRARVMPLRALNASGYGDARDVANAVRWATAHGANIINLSVGAASRLPEVQRALDEASRAGVLLVAAAGNTGAAGLDFPASGLKRDPLGVSVGSVNGADVKSSFSRYARELDLMAPGETLWVPVPGGRLGAWTGTSMAAPLVAGTLALALGEGVPAGALSAALERSAAPLDGVPGNAAYVGRLGDGRLDAGALLRRLNR